VGRIDNEETDGCGACHSVSCSKFQSGVGYTTLFAFGDSLSDAGNAFIATSGKTPASPYVDGHFSNGPTWVEDLSQDLGLGTLGPSLAGGTDFAIGGATTVDLPAEILDFQLYVAAAHVTQVTLNGALFTLDIGANDVIDALPAAEADLPAAETAIKALASNVATEVEGLYTDGARNLLYYEVPNIGLAPEILAKGAAAAQDASTLAQTFNTALLSDLETSNLKIFTLDTYDPLTDAVGDPQAYGFSNVTVPCIDASACLGSSTADQNKYLFWDGLHPTEGGHLLTADLAYALVAPEPSTWAMMLLGFVGLGFAGWRARRTATASGLGA
jgi:phospholipase/lecithinase/hemolysin